MTINPMLLAGNFSWMEHKGSDKATAMKFYETVLDWNINEVPHQNGETYTTIQLGDRPLGGFVQNEEEVPMWLPYITVDDVDKRVDLAWEQGGKIISPPADMPGVGRMAVLTDPQGVRFALITYEGMRDGQENE